MCVLTEVPKCTGCDGRVSECWTTCGGAGQCSACDSLGGTPGACCKPPSFHTGPKEDASAWPDVCQDPASSSGGKVPVANYLHPTANYHQCVITTLDRPSPTPAPTRPPTPAPTAPTAAPTFAFDTYANKACNGNRFTFDSAADCNGWTGVSFEECWQKCENRRADGTSEQAPNCPAAPCVAIGFQQTVLGSTLTSCHHYSSCETLVDQTGTRTRRSQGIQFITPAPTAFERILDQACQNSDLYTFSEIDGGQTCNGWTGITEADCWDKCARNEQAAGCPTNLHCGGSSWFAASVTSSVCHLFSSCTLVASPSNVVRRNVNFAPPTNPPTAAPASDSPTDAPATPPPTNNYERYEAQKCSANSDLYTKDGGSCNGWSSMTEEQCWESCMNNAVPTGCETQAAGKTCSASLWYADYNWCHLYSTCGTPLIAETHGNGVLRKRPSATLPQTPTVPPTSKPALVAGGLPPPFGNITCYGASAGATHCLSWFTWQKAPKWECELFANRPDAETKFAAMEGGTRGVTMYNNEPKELKYYGVIAFWDWNALRKICTTALNVDYASGDHNYKAGAWVESFTDNDTTATNPALGPRRRRTNALESHGSVNQEGHPGH